MLTNPDFYYIPTAIDEEVVNVIINQCKNLELVESAIGNHATNSFKFDYEYRKSKNAWITTDNWISGMMKHFIEVANNNLFHYELNSWAEKIQYTVYDENNSHYKWHHDCMESINKNQIRKLSISLFLSSPDDYEGGEFQIMHMGESKMLTMKPPLGYAIIFPSTTKHRVRPVKSGKRISLVGWYGGPPFR